MCHVLRVTVAVYQDGGTLDDKVLLVDEDRLLDKSAEHLDELIAQVLARGEGRVVDGDVGHLVHGRAELLHVALVQAQVVELLPVLVLRLGTGRGGWHVVLVELEVLQPREQRVGAVDVVQLAAEGHVVLACKWEENTDQRPGRGRPHTYPTAHAHARHNAWYQSRRRWRRRGG